VRGHGAYSKLLLVAVEICKVDWGSVSITEDSCHVVQGGRPSGHQPLRGRWGLHANLTVFLCISDHTRATVLGRIMVGEGVLRRGGIVDWGGREC
jgi:hypothetical protein